MPRKKIQGYDMTNVPLLAIQYVQKKDLIKELDNQCAQLRVPLEKELSDKGRVIDKGNKLLVLEHADVEIHMKHTNRVSVKLVPDAEEILKKESLTEFIKTTTYIDEESLQAACVNGSVPHEISTKLFEVKETKAFSVSLKSKFYGEEVPE